MDSLTFKYKIIKNFLSIDEVELLKRYTIFFHRFNQTKFCEQVNNCDTGCYADPIMEALLDIKTKKMEEVTGFKKLNPTYSFWRMYTYNGELVEHTDRPSCEISVTVQIDSDGTEYPINVAGEDIHLQKTETLLHIVDVFYHTLEKNLQEIFIHKFFYIMLMAMGLLHI